MAKTESKGKAEGNALLAAVSPEKIIKGMTTIFQGFSIMFDGMAEQLELASGMAGQLPGAPALAGKSTDRGISAGNSGSGSKAPSEKADTGQTGSKDLDASGKAQDVEEDTPPWEEEAGKTAPAVITVDDLLKVAAQKITTNRKNSPKIKALLTSYGCGAISELPEDKREAFLNDLAQL